MKGHKFHEFNRLFSYSDRYYNEICKSIRDYNIMDGALHA